MRVICLDGSMNMGQRQGQPGGFMRQRPPQQQSVPPQQLKRSPSMQQQQQMKPQLMPSQQQQQQQIKQQPSQQQLPSQPQQPSPKITVQQKSPQQHPALSDSSVPSVPKLDAQSHTEVAPSQTNPLAVSGELRRAPPPSKPSL